MRSSERHQLKEDQFAAATSQTFTWAAEHRNILTYGVLAIVVIAALLVGGFYYQQNREQQASILLGDALRIYSAPVVPAGTTIPPGEIGFFSAEERAKQASGKFLEVTDNYGRTDSGAMAKYFLGLCSQDMGDNAKAEEYLKSVAGSRRSDIGALAKNALASLYHETGRDQQAIDAYKSLIDKPTNTVPKAQAQMALAELYSAKDPAQARKLYEEIVKENADNPIGNIANARMSQLK
ncbi:MAG TPA: tetratricopeptide repeat protein [Terriglobales bacterium]|nr:tetratricopeptide repeat protein [Terriglobales bacterium]